MTAGSSGEPKLRQLVTAIGVAPVVATLRYASARASFAPLYGSSRAYRPLPSTDSAMPRPLCSSMRTTPASSGWARTVLPRTYRSYCSVTQDLSHRLGQAARRSSVSRSSSPLRGRGSVSARSACSRMQVARLAHRPRVDRSVVDERARRYVDHDIVAPGDDQPARCR